ncbi:hypothetical protein ACOMHN_017282 [Nucella lapillus]
MTFHDVDVDGIQRRLGSGRFQLLVFCALGLIYSRGAWHVFGIMFLAGDPGHWCALPAWQADVVTTLSSVSSSSSWPVSYNRSYQDSDTVLLSSNLTGSYVDGGRSTKEVLPTTLDVSPSPNRLHLVQGDVMDTSIGLATLNWTVDSCTVSYVTQNGSRGKLGKDCPYGWDYGSLFENTVLSEWNLVCGRTFLVELSITIFMVGATGGALLILPLADRWGRKRVMMGCLLGQACVGTATAFVQSYTTFNILRFIIGMLNIGVGLCSFVLMMETFPAHRRTVVSIAFQGFWALGVMTVAAFGYLLRDWRHLELLLSLPNVLAVPGWWLLPESLPWLISQKRWGEAEKTITTIARVNRKNATHITALIPLLTTPTPTPTHHPPVCCNHDNNAASSTNQNAAHKPSGCDDGVAENDVEAMIRGENGSNGVSHVGNGLPSGAPTLSSTNQNGADQTSASAEDDIVEAMIGEKDCSNGVSHLGDSLPNGGGQIGTELSAMREGNTGGNGRNECQGESREVNGKCQSSGGREAKPQTSTSILDLFRYRRMCLYSCVMFFLFFVNSLGYFGISFSVPVLHGNQFVNLCIMGAVEIPANIVCILISQRVGRRYPNAMFLLLCGASNIAAIFLPSHIAWLKLVFVMVGKFAITAAYSTIYLYSAEIFPTVIRNQAMGMSSVFENIGSISAPFIVLAAKSVPEVPLVVFGVLTGAGACLTLLLPETHNRPLPQTVHEITTW